MARRNANLAGLAALGALGYKLANAGTKAPTAAAPSRDDQDFAAMDAEMATMRPQRGYEGSEAVLSDDGTVNPLVRRNTESNDLYYPGGTPSAPAKPKAKAKPQPKYQDDTINPDVKQGRIAGQGGPRGTRYLPVTDTGDETARLARRYPAPPRSDDLASPERRRNAGMLQSIKEYYQSPSSLEGVKRNIANTLNATGGLSVPGFVPKMTQRQFNARAAARRAEEGLSDAEAAAVLRQRALSEADTSGGAIGYKKGGAVKAKKMVVTKMGGKVSSASKRADGIATKGKTRGKLY